MRPSLRAGCTSEASHPLAPSTEEPRVHTHHPPPPLHALKHARMHTPTHTGAPKHAHTMAHPPTHPHANARTRTHTSRHVWKRVATWWLYSMELLSVQRVRNASLKPSTRTTVGLCLALLLPYCSCTGGQKDGTQNGGGGGGDLCSTWPPPSQLGTPCCARGCCSLPFCYAAIEGPASTLPAPTACRLPPTTAWTEPRVPADSAACGQLPLLPMHPWHLLNRCPTSLPMPFGTRPGIRELRTGYDALDMHAAKHQARRKLCWAIAHGS